MGGEVTRFLVDIVNPTGLPQVLEERTALGGLAADFTYGAGLLHMTRAGTPAFHERDGLGSTRLLTDTAGRVTDSYGFQAYGALASSTGSTENAYLFAGERFEAAAGAYDLRARSYDPSVGRFLGRDLAAGTPTDPRSRHPFLYAHADPVNRTDPTGRFSLIELSVASSIQNVVRATFTKNLNTKFFFPVGKIAQCQLRPAFQMRELGMLMSADDLPAGDDLYDLAAMLIIDGVGRIKQAGEDFARSLGELKVVTLKIKLKFLDYVKKVTGADANSLIDPNLSSDARLKKVQDFGDKLQNWMTEYAKAYEGTQSDDPCKQWDTVTFVGTKVLEFLPKP